MRLIFCVCLILAAAGAWSAPEVDDALSTGAIDARRVVAKAAIDEARVALADGDFASVLALMEGLDVRGLDGHARAKPMLIAKARAGLVDAKMRAGDFGGAMAGADALTVDWRARIRRASLQRAEHLARETKRADVLTSAVLLLRSVPVGQRPERAAWLRSIDGPIATPAALGALLSDRAAAKTVNGKGSLFSALNARLLSIPTTSTLLSNTRFVFARMEAAIDAGAMDDVDALMGRALKRNMLAGTYLQIQALYEAQRWDELIDLAQSFYLRPATFEDDRQARHDLFVWTLIYGARAAERCGRIDEGAEFARRVIEEWPNTIWIGEASRWLRRHGRD